MFHGSNICSMNSFLHNFFANKASSNILCAIYSVAINILLLLLLLFFFFFPQRVCVLGWGVGSGDKGASVVVHLQETSFIFVGI